MSDCRQSRRSLDVGPIRAPTGKGTFKRHPRVTTSCTECHKRKQRCNRQQPCNHCSRRFPQPDCIYTSPRPALKTLQAEQSSSNATTRTSSTTQSIHREQENKTRWLDTTCLVPLPQDTVSSYQELLTSMVTALDDEHQNNLLWESKIWFDTSDSRNLAIPVNDEYGNGMELPNIMKPRSDAPRLSFCKMESPYSGRISGDPLHYLPICQSVQNGELFKLFVNLISKYVVSLDGNPSPNYYNDTWVPRAMGSRILSNMAMFTSACYQAESQRIPASQSPVATSFKMKSITLLNELLSDRKMATSDETITAVVYFITNEWYWGITNMVNEHMKGLSEIVKQRGGVDAFDLTPFVRKMVILCDYHIACTYDNAPCFKHNLSPLPSIFPLHLNTPLLPSGTSFASISSTLNIAQGTALILDDMRFLTNAVLQQITHPLTDKSFLKLTTTAAWIRDRIAALPEESTSSAAASMNPYIYTTVLLASRIYVSSILTHTPLSESCTTADLNHIWSKIWRVTLTQWKAIPGVFIWVLLVILQASREKEHGRLVKSMLRAACYLVAVGQAGKDGYDEIGWAVVEGALERWVGVTAWMRKSGEVFKTDTRTLASL
ncbi:hypothetical protein F5884DRAFT_769898 [Xylogone sp. PMI_703]|nr:hypothetical protein F5884DRAFT_769898 [Xylogone sp. PMI_703]